MVIIKKKDLMETMTMTMMVRMLKRMVRLKSLWLGARARVESPPASPTHAEARAPSVEETPVKLNIYDVTTNPTVQWINSLFANQYSPVKFGGIFHVGVQIGSREWAFGYKPSGTGVFWTGLPVTLLEGTPPLFPGQHHFRETIDMPPTTLSRTEIAEVMTSLEIKWSGPSYNVFRRNCCHFADEVCEILGVGNIPEWTYRLANIGSTAAEDGSTSLLPLSYSHANTAPAVADAPAIARDTSEHMNVDDMWHQKICSQKCFLVAALGVFLRGMRQCSALMFVPRSDRLCEQKLTPWSFCHGLSTTSTLTDRRDELDHALLAADLEDPRLWLCGLLGFRDPFPTNLLYDTELQQLFALLPAGVLLTCIIDAPSGDSVLQLPIYFDAKTGSFSKQPKTRHSSVWPGQRFYRPVRLWASGPKEQSHAGVCCQSHGQRPPLLMEGPMRNSALLAILLAFLQSGHASFLTTTADFFQTGCFQLLDGTYTKDMSSTFGTTSCGNALCPPCFLLETNSGAIYLTISSCLSAEFNTGLSSLSLTVFSTFTFINTGRGAALISDGTNSYMVTRSGHRGSTIVCSCITSNLLTCDASVTPVMFQTTDATLASRPSSECVSITADSTYDMSGRECAFGSAYCPSCWILDTSSNTVGLTLTNCNNYFKIDVGSNSAIMSYTFVNTGSNAATLSDGTNDYTLAAQGTGTSHTHCVCHISGASHLLACDVPAIAATGSTPINTFPQDIQVATQVRFGGTTTYLNYVSGTPALEMYVGSNRALSGTSTAGGSGILHGTWNLDAATVTSDARFKCLS
eukprot:s782_g1.t1